MYDKNYSSISFIPRSSLPFYLSKQTDNFSSSLSGCCSLSSGQHRLLGHISSMCAAFVLKVRAWCAESSAASECDINSLVQHVLTHSQQLLQAPVNNKQNQSDNNYYCNRQANQCRSTCSGDESYSSPSILPFTSAFSSSLTPVVPLIADRISLPGPDRLNIIPMCDLLPMEVAQRYAAAPSLCPFTSASSSPLLRPPHEIFELNTVSPLRPARVAGSRREYVRLIGRMLKQGMIGFTSTPKAVNGIFAVGKDAESDRLIIDAQPANRLFIQPSHANLPNPSHIVQLQVSGKKTMFVGKSDLSNFYHHLGLPQWMQSFFALPRLTREELIGIGYTGDSSQELFPMCLTMPMGFSHAVDIAQSCHEHILYSTGILMKSDNILFTSSPLVTDDRILHGIVIDDFFMFALNRQMALDLFTRVIAAYRSVGLVVKQSKVVEPTSDPVKVIGFDIDGAKHSVSLPTDSIVSLVSATLSVLQRGCITGLGLSHLIGRWTWLMLLRRPSLSILQHVYRFITVAHTRRFDLWPSVRRELWMLIGILPMLSAQLDSPINSHLVATDASMVGGGVVSTQLTRSLMKQIWPMCSSKQHVRLQTLLQRESQQANPIHLLSSAHSLAPVDEDTLDQLVVSQSVFDSFYSLVSGLSWSTIISHRWRDSSEHINSLELRAVLLSVHWLLSFPSSLTSRVYLLVDSTVALYSLWKGRSSSPLLLLILRKISSLLLASGMMLMTSWIPSEVNPADEPSRIREE